MVLRANMEARVDLHLFADHVENLKKCLKLASRSTKHSPKPNVGLLSRHPPDPDSLPVPSRPLPSHGDGRAHLSAQVWGGQLTTSSRAGDMCTSRMVSGYHGGGAGVPTPGLRVVAYGDTGQPFNLVFFFCFLPVGGFGHVLLRQPANVKSSSQGAKVHPTQFAQPPTANDGQTERLGEEPAAVEPFLGILQIPHPPRSTLGSPWRSLSVACEDLCDLREELCRWYEDGRRCGASALVVQRVQRVNHVSIVHRLGRSILSLEIDRLARGLLNGKVKVQSMVRASSSQL